MPKLKKIDLRGSNYLIELPDLSQAPNITVLALAGCTNLVEVRSSKPLVNLGFVSTLACRKLKHVNLAGNLHVASSKRLLISNFFDMKYLYFAAWVLEALISRDGSICGLQLRKTTLPVNKNLFKIANDVNTKESIRLAMLVSSLPFVDQLCWSSFPSSVEMGKQHFETHGGYKRHFRVGGGFIFQTKLRETVEEEKTFRQPNIKGETVTKEVGLALEKWTGPEDLTEVDCECLSKISNITRWSLLTCLSLPFNIIEGFRIACLMYLAKNEPKDETKLTLKLEWPPSKFTSPTDMLLSEDAFWVEPDPDSLDSRGLLIWFSDSE